MQYLPASKIPDGVFKIANEMRGHRLFRRLGKRATKLRYLIVPIPRFVFFILVARLK